MNKIKKIAVSLAAVMIVLLLFAGCKPTENALESLDSLDSNDYITYIEQIDKISTRIIGIALQTDDELYNVKRNMTYDSSEWGYNENVQISVEISSDYNRLVIIKHNGIAIMEKSVLKTATADAVLENGENKFEISVTEENVDSAVFYINHNPEEEQLPEPSTTPEQEETYNEAPTISGVLVPNVVGMKEQEAVDTLKAAGFNSAVAHSVHETAQRGTIFQQDQAGQRLPVTETILLWVSDGTSEYTLERAARKEAEWRAASKTLSSEARLKYIQIIEDPKDYLADKFDPDIYEYTVEKRGYDYVSIYEPMHSGATVEKRVDYDTDGSSERIDIISLTVTAEDGITKLTYTIYVYINPSSM